MNPGALNLIHNVNSSNTITFNTCGFHSAPFVNKT